MTSPNSVLLSTEQAAAILDVGEHRITQLCRDRILAGTKRKGKWLIAIDSVRAYEGSRKGKVPIEVGCVRRVRGHLLHYLSVLGGEAQSYGVAITELHAKSFLDNYSLESLKGLEASIAGISRCIEEVWADIRRLDDELRLAGFGSILTPEQGG